MLMHFDIARKKSIGALEDAMAHNQLVFFVTQKSAETEEPKRDDLYGIGTIARVKQMLKLPGDGIRVLVEGISRAKLSHLFEGEKFHSCEITQREDVFPKLEPDEEEAMKRKLVEIFEEYRHITGKAPEEALRTVKYIDDANRLTDVVASGVSLKVEEKQKLLQEFDPYRRIMLLISMLLRELNILQVEQKINHMVKNQMDQNQREYFLREQMKAIQNELGDTSEEEIEQYRAKFDAFGLIGETREKLDRELERLEKLPSSSQEASVLRSYLDVVCELPWNLTTKETVDLSRSRKILDKDHYGLKDVKERVLEFLAVKKLTGTLQGPILCLAGPPGVGKTSIAKSVAKALGRNYVRLSLGGVRDEAEIRGHRKTYIGAMPGRIINALRQAKSNNPLILLDEIDKMSHDFRGDPASAMLEVLDSEQNHAFRDHYLEVPFDLSQVMFITTANQLDTVPAPLLDRMEVIDISGYTNYEKKKIAEQYLIPKQRKENGLTGRQISFDEQSVTDILDFYTREAGVRHLEREIGTVCRRVARQIAEGTVKSIKITAGNLEQYLGKRKYHVDLMQEHDEIGIANGLAWTAVGGVTLTVEVNVMDGNGKIELTGQLGDVMQESAKAAISFLRSRADELGIDADFYKNKDLHIHVPEGATPKDGPSAGITMATAILSALTGIPVRRDVAMTGEITLRGRVLPIGGLKEKSLAAYRAGMKTVLMPEENRKDLEDIPEEIRNQMQFVPVSRMEEVIELTLTKKTEPKETVFLPQQPEKGVEIRQ
ncbi:MAG: endopeptidase La [Ruminococcaceae bacterium]|nr:endopeptidase La [Oscillospiraceae bacterium]